MPDHARDGIEGEDSTKLPRAPRETENPVVQSGRDSIAALTGAIVLSYPLISWHSDKVRSALREGHAKDLGFEAFELNAETVEEITKGFVVAALRTRALKALDEILSDRDFSQIPKEFGYRVSDIEIAIKNGIPYEDLGITKEILENEIPTWNWNKGEPLDHLQTLRLPTILPEGYERELISGVKDCIATLSCDIGVDTAYALLGTSKEELDSILPWFHAKRRALKAIEIFRKREADDQFVLSDATSSGLEDITYTHFFTYIHNARKIWGISCVDLGITEEEVERFNANSFKYDFHGE